MRICSVLAEAEGEEILKTSEKVFVKIEESIISENKKVFCDTWASDALLGVTFTFGHFIMGRTTCAYLNITQNYLYKYKYIYNYIF